MYERKIWCFLNVFLWPKICLQSSKLTFNSRKTLEFKRVKRMISNRSVAEPTHRTRIRIPYSKFDLKKNSKNPGKNRSFLGEKKLNASILQIVKAAYRNFLWNHHGGSNSSDFIEKKTLFNESCSTTKKNPYKIRSDFFYDLW